MIEIDIAKLMESNKKEIESGQGKFPEILIENEDSTADTIVLGFLAPREERGNQLYNIGADYRKSNPDINIKNIILNSSAKAHDRRVKETYQVLIIVQKEIKSGKTIVATQKFLHRDSKIEFINGIEFDEDIETGILDAFLKGFYGKA